MNTELTHPHWMNEEALHTLSNGYLLVGETPKDMFSRLAKTASKINEDPTLDEDLFHCLWSGWIGAASPVASNFGTNRGQPISCFSVHPSDSISSIYSHLKEVAQLSKSGGGVGNYFGEIRPAGSPITGGGKSIGAVPWMQQYDICARVVSQGGVRRGSFAFYLPIDHPDVPELLRAKDHTKGDPRTWVDSNIALTISDEWIESMIKGDKQKHELFAEVLRTRMISGTPYLIFIDNANNQNPDCYKERGLTVKTSNLCFTADTLVAVADGRNSVPIGDLVNTSFPVYSARQRRYRGTALGNQWVTEIKNAIAFKTGTREVIEVELEDGSTFKCTPDHLLAKMDCSYVEAEHSVGETLEPFSSFVNEFGHRMINTVTNGHSRQSRLIWTNVNGQPPKGYNVDHLISGGGDNIENLQILRKEAHHEKTSTERKGLGNPIHKVDPGFHSKYASAAVTGKKNPRFSGIDNYKLIELGQEIYKETGSFTKQDYLTLRERGYNVPYSFSNYRFGGSFSDYRNYVLGEDTYGGEYEVGPEAPVNIRKEEKERTKSKVSDIRRNGLRVTSVRSIGIEDVYDLRVEDNHNFYIITKTGDINSGVLVHNCSEIFLHTDENHSFVCVLSSLNLSRYDEYKDWKSPTSGRTVPQIGIHFLEAVVSEFIRKAKDKVGMGRSVRFAEKSRALGLGVMGLHSLYQLHGLPVKSQGARELNVETTRWMKEEAVKASKELAERFGEPEWCKGTGMRHTHLIAIAPTKTNSVICGAGTEGIEPRDRNYYVAKQAKGTYVRKNQYLKKIFCDRGVGPEVWDQILVAKGSVQGVECLTEHEKEVFRTAREVDQFELIKQAADRQPYVCQGQSLNLFPDPKSDASYITRLHLAAWKMGLKSLYYLKSSSLLTNKEVVPALIVTREGCPWCVKLKNELSMDGVRYEEITKVEAEEKGFWNPEWTTVPQLWLFKKHIGGYTDYIEYKQSNNTETVSAHDDSDGAYNECKSCEA
jgi:ribonucleoside-diphosphate reductase alpha chain